MMKYSKSQKGFTLIELLIVIAIIGILAAVILIALAGARQRARDAARKSDVNNIRTAVEVFATDDPDGSYPSPLSELVTGTNPSEYIQEGPAGLVDPQGANYKYSVTTDLDSYCIGAALERDEDPDALIINNEPHFVQGPDCPIADGTYTWQVE